MKIDLSVNKVTTVSKILALIIFVTFPLFGFWLGIQFQKTITPVEIEPIPLGGWKQPLGQSPKPTTDIYVGWKEYTIKLIGLKIKLPKSINQLNTETATRKGEIGTQICFEAKESQSFNIVKQVLAGGGACWPGIFGIGSLSKDYEAGRMGWFSDVRGYLVSSSDYYTVDKSGQLFTDKPAIPYKQVEEYKNGNGIKMLIIKGKDDLDENFGPTATYGTPGEGYIGAIINNKDKNYPGITIWMKLQGELNEEMFMKILDTVEL